MALETAFSFIQSSFTLPLAQAEPAGGAAIDQIVIATVGASLIFGALSWLCLRHRAGKTDVLRRASARVGGFTGLPGWAALPIALAGVSLVTALLGMYWDISLHIDVGRDAGPLANPAHYLILAGLFGVLAAGMLAIFLPEQRPGPASIRLAGEWHAPIGGITLTACGAFSLIGFPLDDIWHRLFGQDVTLWGPTHLMLIGGAAMTIVGMSLLLVEGMRFRDSNRSRPLEPRVRRRSDFLVVSRRIGLAGALLIGLSTFQAEWDFGVPQFPMELEPLLLALAASMALVCARIWIGPGGAFAAAGFYILARGLTSVMVGPVLGETLPHMPIYLAEAVLVELTALAIIRLGAGRLHPIRFGLASGLLIGTVGFAAEWGWSHLWMPIPWTTDLLPTAPILALAAALAGGVAGALLASALRGELPRLRLATPLALTSLLAIMAAVGWGLQTTTPAGVAAQITLTGSSIGTSPAASGPAGESAGRWADAEVRIEPPSAVDEPSWLTVTSWQGGGLVVDRLQPVAGEPGSYTTSEPIPVDGEWKTMLRLHQDDEMLGSPIYLPLDEAIPAPEVPALIGGEAVTRPVISDHQLLQREQKQGVASWLTTIAPLSVLGIALSLIALLAWGVRRVGRPLREHAPGHGGEAPGHEPEQAPARAEQPSRVATA